MSVFQRLYRGETRFDFIGTRRRWYLASLIIIVICVLSFVLRGFNWGIEFKGGSQFTILTKGTPITAKEAESAFARAGLQVADAARVVGSGDSRQIVVKTNDVTPAE